MFYWVWQLFDSQSLAYNIQVLSIGQQRTVLVNILNNLVSEQRWAVQLYAALCLKVLRIDDV